MTAKGQFELPLSKVEGFDAKTNRIKEIFIDPELGNEAITYLLESGEENSIHLDVFLDYNSNPDLLRMLFLFEMSIEARKALKISGLSKNEICRRLQTSPSQLNRLFDQKNHKKSVDKMLQLLAVLGVTVRPVFEIRPDVA